VVDPGASHANGKNIHRPVELADIHSDSSGHGWGAVLNGRLEALGFWGPEDEHQHITWNELKAVRLADLSFLPLLAGRNILLHEDNQAVCYILVGLTYRSPDMMNELRQLWYMLDTSNIHIRPRYTMSAANTWADKLSHHLDIDDWQLDPSVFHEMDTQFGPHTIDRFASALNTLLPRYNANWLDPSCEAVNSLHLADTYWREENKMQPSMAIATRPRPKATSERRSNYSGRPALARKSVALGNDRVGVPRDGLAGPRALVPSTEAARTRYNRQASLARHCLPDSLPAWLYLRRGAVGATFAMFNTRQIRPTIHTYPTRAPKVRYKIEVAGCNNPWTASMRPYMQRLYWARTALKQKLSSY
jgi:hypothetical protein